MVDPVVETPLVVEPVTVEIPPAAVPVAEQAAVEPVEEPLVVLAIRPIPVTLPATVVLSVRAMSSVFHAPVTPRTLAIRTAPAT